MQTLLQKANVERLHSTINAADLIAAWGKPMMSLEVIRELAREQGNRAKREGMKPFIVWPQDLEDWKAALDSGRFPCFPFPNMGAYVPRGWKATGRDFFCDKFGIGDEGPAMSARELVESLEPGNAYAITEEGEFQLYVSEFEPPQQYPPSNENHQ